MSEWFSWNYVLLQRANMMSMSFGQSPYVDLKSHLYRFIGYSDVPKACLRKRVATRQPQLLTKDKEIHVPRGGSKKPYPCYLTHQQVRNPNGYATETRNTHTRTRFNFKAHLYYIQKSYNTKIYRKNSQTL